MTDQAAMTDQGAATEQAATTGSGNAESQSEAPTFAPPADIVETKDAVIMLLDMPGADPDSLDVALEKQELRVSARSASSAPPGYTLMHAEYRDGNYERAFTLSEQVDGERVDAIFKDGVLRLTLPKARASQARKIEVKAA